MPGTLLSDAVQCKKDVQDFVTKLKALNLAQHSDKTREIDAFDGAVSDGDFFMSISKDVIDWLMKNVEQFKHVVDIITMDEKKADSIVHDWSDAFPKELAHHADDLKSLGKQIAADWGSSTIPGLNFDSTGLDTMASTFGQLQDGVSGPPGSADHPTWFVVRQTALAEILIVSGDACLAVGELINKVNDLIKKMIKKIKDGLAKLLLAVVNKILTAIAEKIPGVGWLMEGIDVIANHSDALTRLIRDITDVIKELMKYKDAVWEALKEADAIVRAGEKVFKDVGNLQSHFK
ncbi:hypothetical protein Srot_0259 [Segniliparus rotundus DSM 44985]|uniref:Uncharacterized protein n=1 Tax=Segniliparus rotundus (strain ATCC BAA-972 / CDC 1076 / CIP 108378 / DSM 44985 / JCM 13578) TaxID=640132 RepID=D6ZAY7_SEGRD|nr:hypothetical protein [Segniliparus rotundus]ADG96746.1 hypothetical protein Srot_0259 [Segniliparus rotundus DSM 44985]